MKKIIIIAAITYILVLFAHACLYAQEAGTWRIGASGHAFNYIKYNGGIWKSPVHRYERPFAYNGWGASLNTGYQITDRWSIETALGYVQQQSTIQASNGTFEFFDTLLNDYKQINYYTHKNFSKYAHIKVPLTAHYTLPLSNTNFLIDFFGGVQGSYLQSYYFRNSRYDVSYHTNFDIEQGVLESEYIDNNGSLTANELDINIGTMLPKDVSNWSNPTRYKRYTLGTLGGLRIAYLISEQLRVLIGYRVEYDITDMHIANKAVVNLHEFFAGSGEYELKKTHNIRQGADIGVQYSF